MNRGDQDRLGGAAPAGARRFAGTLQPLGHVVFRRFWLASMGSNFGSMVQTVGAAWMMTSLIGDAQYVALVQTAATLPMMLLSLPAGALADVFDRRRVMLCAQGVLLVAGTTLAGLTLMGLMTAHLLLGFTFLIGCGTALYGPSWQASVADQVPRETLDAAIGLNSVGFNIARSLGPAIGGLIVAALGVAAAFTLNALSYLGLIATLLTWRPAVRAHTLPPERVPSAIGAGLRYVLLSPQLMAVMARGSLYGFCGSCVWALTPLLVRNALHGGPSDYGLLLGGFGIGAIGGALMRANLAIGRPIMVRLCTLAFGLSAILLGLNHRIILALPLMAVAGGAWVMCLTGLSVAVQVIAPRWVVGRAIAINQMAIFAGMASGSAIWGLVAKGWRIETAFLISGTTMLATLIVARWLPVTADTLDLTPARAQPLDSVTGPIGADDGPIIVMIDYRVPLSNASDFVTAMDALGRIRRREGAMRWSLMQDLDDPERWTERFHSPTWLDHLRRQIRPVRADDEARHRVGALHDGQQIVRRLLPVRSARSPLVGKDITPTATSSRDIGS